MFMVTTTDGTRVHAGVKEGHGLEKDQAEASAAERNKRASEMGIKTRYEVREYAKP